MRINRRRIQGNKFLGKHGYLGLFWRNGRSWILSSVTQLKRIFASNETMDLDTGVESGLNNDL